MFLTRGLIFFFKCSYSQYCFNVVKIYVGNFNVVSTLSNVQINFEVDNVDLTFNVLNFNADVHNVVSTLI